MKCEKCEQNEASVYCRVTVNGQTTEQHLCADCAGELGLDRAFGWQSRELMEEAFGGFFGRDPFESFFARSLLPGIARRTTAPAGTLPRTETRRREAPSGTEGRADTKTDPALERRREINALREQLNAAVKAEEFEKAVELRDKLRELEK